MHPLINNYMRYISTTSIITLFSFCALTAANAQQGASPAAPADTNKTANKPDTPTAGTGTANNGANKDTPKIDTLSNVIIQTISDDASTLQAVSINHDTTWTLSVKTAELKTVLKTYYPEDRVSIIYQKNKSDNELKSISVKTHTVSVSSRIWTFILTIAGVLFVFYLLLGKKLPGLILGLDNRYSNSKFQIVVWFFTLLVVYIITTLFRSHISIDFIGGISIPTNLLMLSGLSALTFATAKGITESKVKEAETKGITDSKPSAVNPKFPTDLFTDDAGNIDMANFQMIIFTFLAVITYIVQVFGFLGTIELHKVINLPDVDSTILAVFGLGHGAYLAKKLVSNTNNA